MSDLCNSKVLLNLIDTVLLILVMYLYTSLCCIANFFSDLQSFDSRGWPQSKKAARQLKDMSHSNSMGDLYEMFDDMPLEEVNDCFRKI